MIQRRKLARVQSEYEPDLRAHPADARLRLRYADACARIGANVEAAAAFHAAGCAFARLQQFSFSRAALRRAVELAPTDLSYARSLQRVEQQNVRFMVSAAGQH